MMSGGLCNETLRYVENWIPERNYRSETKFQNDLQGYLDQRLNEGGQMGLGMGGQEQVPVRREYGGVNADVAVGEDVGIEIKRNFTNSQRDRLSGQIKRYKNEFSCVIVVACGIRDKDGWRELHNQYNGNAGFGMSQSQVHFVHKRKDNFGSDQSGPGSDGDGVFGGGGLF